ALYSAQAVSSVSIELSSSEAISEVAIRILTKAVSNMLIQLQERCLPSAGNQNQPVCYKCGQVGHI
ncbi:24016_t:CDS:1, partial [Gigaspora rosea]